MTQEFDLAIWGLDLKAFDLEGFVLDHGETVLGPGGCILVAFHSAAIDLEKEVDLEEVVDLEVTVDLEKAVDVDLRILEAEFDLGTVMDNLSVPVDRPWLVLPRQRRHRAPYCRTSAAS